MPASTWRDRLEHAENGVARAKHAGRSRPTVPGDLDSPGSIASAFEKLKELSGPASLRLVGSQYEQLAYLVLAGLPLDIVDIVDTVDGGNPSIFAFLRFLRDCTGAGIRILWRHRPGTFPSNAPQVADYFHLYPPDVAVGVQTTDNDSAWRAKYRFGDLYYRVGPGFVSIIRNSEGNLARYVIDEAAELDVFTKALSPSSVADVATDPLRRASLHELSSEGIVAVNEGVCLTLPYRMSRWPIPMLGV